MKQPKNSLIAIMVLINIALTLFVLLNNSDVELEKTVHAQSFEANTDDVNRKRDEEVNPNAVEEAEELEEATILFNIKGVTSYDSDLPTTPLYYHHSNKEGAFFTYKPLEKGEQWDGGYWFVDHKTIKEAHIEYLMRNDIVQGVFYNGEYFEIKERLTENK